MNSIESKAPLRTLWVSSWINKPNYIRSWYSAMPRASLLSKCERAAVVAIQNGGLSTWTISRRTIRSSKAILMYVSDKSGYGTPGFTGENTEMTATSGHLLLREASGQSKTASQLLFAPQLPIWTRHVHSILSAYSYMAYRKIESQPLLATQRKNDRVKSAGLHYNFASSQWRTFVFSDENNHTWMLRMSLNNIGST